MKISSTWINDNLDKNLSAEQIAEALERAGVEVEQIDYPRDSFENIVVGLVNKVVQHPNADRLRLALVDTGDQDLHIVCGAPNVREGLKVAVAMPGAILPDGTVIKTSKIRGEVSEGMLCSERELGLGESHEGILELPPDTSIGSPFGGVTKNDVTLHIKTAANRPDLQSAVGLSREVAAITNVGLLSSSLAPRHFAHEGELIGEVDKAAPRFMVARLQLDPEAETPEWMAQKLEAVGIRSLGPVVDITNYVMFEWGQPLHAYDAERVHGAVGVRFAVPGEKLKTLDDRERTLTGEDLVIADEKCAIGLAGVMGGAQTEVNAESRTILLEAAVFTGGTVRKSALRHGLRSEASGRFERGLPVQLTPVAMERALELLEEICGAKVLETQERLQVWPWVQRIGLRRGYVNRMLGTSLEPDDIISTLSRVGIAARAFDIAEEARKHLGKPYIWGASYKKNGTDGFDCSYLTDFLYSLIGMRIGYTSLAQYEIGQPVDVKDLRPGDILFYEGYSSGTDEASLSGVGRGRQAHSIVGHYYLWNQSEGKYERVEAKTKGLVGHNGLYIGGGRVIHASRYEFRDGGWHERKDQGVLETTVEEFTSNPGYLGARRFAEELDDYLAIEAVPWWRTDLKEPADLVEEIVRLIGYEQVPSTLPVWRPIRIDFDRERTWLRTIRETMYGLGAFEVYTYSFVSKDQLDNLGASPEAHLKLANPLSSEQEYLRTSPLPSLLAAVGRNEAARGDFGLYEMTSVFEPTGDDTLPAEPRRLALIWRRDADTYRKVKGALDLLTGRLGLAFDLEVSDRPEFEPGRAAAVRLSGKKIGRIGQVSRRVLRGRKIKGEVSYLELDLDALLAKARPTAYRPLSRFPSTSRDISIVLPESVLWRDISAAIEKTGLAQPRYLSEYRSEEIGRGRKSLAVRLVMGSDERTLTDAEAADREERVLRALRKKFSVAGR